MSRSMFLAALSALALAGCGPGGGDEATADGGGAAGKAENGQLTVRAQGVDLKIDIPRPLRRMAGDDGGAFLYPGARAERGGEGEDERFHSDDPPETVARWYRDPARAGRFTIATVDRRGPALVLAGTARDGDALRVRLLPGPRGGTDGTVTVTAVD